MSGVTYYIPCPHCHKLHEVTYGTSMICTRNSLIVSSLYNGGKPLLNYLVRSKKILNKTFELLNSGYDLEPDFSYSMYYCKKCQKLYIRFHYILSNQEQQTWEPPYSCHVCKHHLTRILQDELSEYPVMCSCGTSFQIDLTLDPAPENWN